MRVTEIEKLGWMLNNFDTNEGSTQSDYVGWVVPWKGDVDKKIMLYWNLDQAL